jgi:hypothetical protein
MLTKRQQYIILSLGGMLVLTFLFFRAYYFISSTATILYLLYCLKPKKPKGVLSPLDYEDARKLAEAGNTKGAIILLLKRGYGLSEDEIYSLTQKEVTDLLTKLVNIVKCANPNCEFYLPPSVNYCPHCGASQKAPAPK